MIVCHCRGVSEATIDAAIAAGASSTREVTAKCRAGGRCGSCIPAIEDLLARAEEAASELVAEPAA